MSDGDASRPSQPPDPSASPAALHGTPADAEAFLRSILRAAPVFIIRAGADERVRFSNRIAEGLTPEQVIGRDIYEFIDETSRPEARRAIERALASGQPSSFESTITRPTGQVFVYEIHVAPTPDEDGRVGFTFVAVDVTSQRARERELRESQERVRLAIEATNMGLWSWDLRTGRTEWSAQMFALTGLSEPVSAPEYLERLVHPDDRAWVAREMEENMRRGQMQTVPHRIVRPDGSVRWVLHSGTHYYDEQGNVVRVVGGVLDVTRRKELEEQLRHAQKMEAVGELAAGIAHNFNNMLAVMIPALEMGQPYVPPAYHQVYEQALHAGGRAAEMIQQLLTFAGKKRGTQPWRDQPIEDPVRRAVSICERLFEKRIKVTVALDAPSALVCCDAGQIEQAIVNVLLNARDAVLEGREHGSIDVGLDVVRGDELEASGLDVQRGAWARIRITDDGIGMSDEVRRRVFEPFFTTKEPGRGTGLGLATTFAIVQEHGGALTCASQPGAGATFDVYLPIIDSSIT